MRGSEAVWHSTTIVAVRRNGQVAVAGDGQVTLNETVIKSRARKVQRMMDGQVIVGFAGAVADALTLFEKFEGKLGEARGNLRRAAVELAKEWRTDRILRHLQAMLLAADRETILLIAGTGEVLEAEEDVAAAGSGGPYALSAAKALLRHTSLSAEEIAREAMRIAASVCIYTNAEIVVEVLE